MTNIYLIRHAESVANTQGAYQGQTYDTDLSDLGLLQIQTLAHRFLNTRFDAIYTSPLKRAIRTAQVLGQPIADPALIETDHGTWEGKTKSEVVATWPNLHRLWHTRPGEVCFPGGESFQMTYQRIIAWWDRLIQRPGTFTVITHSNIIMALLCHLQSQELNQMWQYAMQPTAVTLVRSHSPTKIIYLNDISHLKGLKSDLSIQAI